MDELINQSPHRIGKSLGLIQANPNPEQEQSLCWFVVIFKAKLDNLFKTEQVLLFDSKTTERKEERLIKKKSI